MGKQIYTSGDFDGELRHIMASRGRSELDRKGYENWLV